MKKIQDVVKMLLFVYDDPKKIFQERSGFLKKSSGNTKNVG